ncbi:immunoglobulin-like domain-containing protein [Clostridium felsineum]|uniref:Atrophied bacterial Ig domain-containing protein n=1 Tax=Clostridium felsineum TaxID=36839 RepID=A0A1S8L1R3_9CLOT|nr:immunoglobulin-like domain-containing protein [Clostridium felsineum]URZ09241.1 hypothetical protein CLROS_046570 [Clostridium felsineum]URZ13927.1 hypothetical protein CROST_047050 [Clostridium felsineum]
MIKAHIIRPDYGKNDGAATLTATLTKGSVTKTMTFKATVKQQGKTDNQSVTDDFNWLTIAGSDAGITSNILLPAAGPNGSTIAWKTSNADVINIDGGVKRPDNGADKASVTLSATISKGTVTQNKDIVVTVLPWTDKEEVELAINAITWDSIRNQNTVEDEITTDLNLYTTGDRKTTIVWNPTYPSVIDATGKVTRPTYEEGDCTLSIPATVSKGKVAEHIQNFLGLKVLKLQITNKEAVSKAKTIVDGTMIKGKNTDLKDMTDSVVLPSNLDQYMYPDLKPITLQWKLVRSLTDATEDTTNSAAKIVTDSQGVQTLSITRPASGNQNGTAFLEVNITSVTAQGDIATDYNIFPLIIIASK